MSDEVKDGAIQYVERKFASEIADLSKKLGEEVAHRQRADGLFRAADLELNRLKLELESERLARQDADRRFAEQSMVVSRVREALGCGDEADVVEAVRTLVLEGK